MKSMKLHSGSVIDICDDDANLKAFIEGKINSLGRGDKDDAFLVCDLGDVVKKWKRFKKNLPRVEPFYAMKCNPNPNVCKLLGKLGVNFDCASKNEIKQVLDYGVAPERIIYANPCKQRSFIKYAATNNVNLMTFDNSPELHKIKQCHPNANLVLRIKVDDSLSVCQFGIKFGAGLSQTKELLEEAWKLELDVVGVSFHVGSQCHDVSQFYNAVEAAFKVFQQAASVGYTLNLLDIGGGFPGTDEDLVTFEETAQVLNMAFEKFFPDNDVRIIAEPGRYYVASAFTSVCNITSVREIEKNKKAEGFMYYLNDGVYGSFNCILFDHSHPVPKILFDDDNSDKLFKCSLWGPTCDSIDCITKETLLPQLTIGDWLYFDNMGAYTIAAGSVFNGFKKPSVLYMCRSQYARLLLTEVKDTLLNKTPVPKVPQQIMNAMKAIQLN